MIINDAIWRYMAQQVYNYDLTKTLNDWQEVAINAAAVHYMKHVYDAQWENMKKDALGHKVCRAILEQIESILFNEDMEQKILSKEAYEKE